MSIWFQACALFVSHVLYLMKRCSALFFFIVVYFVGILHEIQIQTELQLCMFWFATYIGSGCG